jgi:7,8-dihydropterin-6-yl-methyl-4-(beta-D-ribofuranosyl)aminobenzene 5'-phosphate synthase
MKNMVRLDKVDQVSITILVDNYTDILLASSDNVQRPPIINKKDNALLIPVAEHGFASLIEIKYDNSSKTSKFLFDAGVSPEGLLFNAKILGVNLAEIDSIILSHGHADHYTGLMKLLQYISRPIPLYAHPDAFLKRWLILPDDSRVSSTLNEDDLKKYGAVIYKNNEVTALPDKSNPRLLITGQIPRVTNFEKGFPFQYKESPETGEIVHDPLIYDDQALIANVKDRGLVILTACGHAGVINTIKYAKKITGIENVYAIIGGFHLSGKIYEDIIDPTLDELVKVDARFIVPCHCTGWKAINKIIQSVPDSFIQSSVGSKFLFF